MRQCIHCCAITPVTTASQLVSSIAVTPIHIIGVVNAEPPNFGFSCAKLSFGSLSTQSGRGVYTEGIVGADCLALYTRIESSSGPEYWSLLTSYIPLSFLKPILNLDTKEVKCSIIVSLKSQFPNSVGLNKICALSPSNLLLRTTVHLGV